MDSNSAATDGSMVSNSSATVGPDIELVRSLITFLRDEVDHLDKRIQQQRSMTSLDETDGGSGNELYGKYVSNIRGILQAILRFLQTPFGASATVSALQEYRQVINVIKKMAETLGPVIMMFGISAIICYYGKQLHNSKMRMFSSEKAEIERQMEHLKKVLERISQLLDRANKYLEPLLGHFHDFITKDAGELDDVIGEIEQQIVIGKNRLQLAEEIFRSLNEKMANYRQSGLLTNFGVFVGSSIVSGLFYNLGIIDKKVTAVWLVVGGLPFLHSYFHLTLSLSEMMTEIRQMELENKSLQTELNIYAVQLDGIKRKKRDVCEPNTRNDDRSIN